VLAVFVDLLEQQSQITQLKTTDRATGVQKRKSMEKIDKDLREK
jgi:hypothetical protein